MVLAVLAVGTIDNEPGDVALAALVSDDRVTLTRSDGTYRFEPAGPSCVGFVFYPGGLVEGEAYAAHLRPVAEAGHTVVVVDPPLNLAVLDADAADDILGDYPSITRWVVGGHSLGGAMAARFATGAEVDGLVLWAAFPSERDDLSGRDLSAASIYGTRDGVATPDEVTGAAARLPAGTAFVAIEGGNHAQFGDYGPQRGDEPATISADEQRDEVAAATASVLDDVADRSC